MVLKFDLVLVYMKVFGELPMDKLTLSGILYQMGKRRLGKATTGILKLKRFRTMFITTHFLFGKVILKRQ